ncbi:MAG: DUF3810 family protein [Saprospirales bacterium]|nr:DUF3810 family protein [Saprospirales bacterium]
MPIRNRYLRRSIWIGLFLLALAFRAILSSEAMESFYSMGIYPSVRHVQGFFSGLSPVPLVYLLLLALLAITVRVFIVKGRRRGLWAILSAVFFLAFSFLALWGFHYKRVPFEKKTGLSVKPLDAIALEEEYDLATMDVLASRGEMRHPLDSGMTGFYAFPHLERALLPRVKAAVGGWGYPVGGKVRARMIYPKGILLRFSSSGVYLPWTGEGHIDAGLHPLNWPFVIAHEMSHGYGIANEGACNFLAYQVCSTDPDPYIRYAGNLYYWRYAAYEMKRFCPLELEERIQALPEGIRMDLQAIRDNYDSYPDLIPRWKDLVYDSFLKSQGLKEGILSYDKVLVLTHAWRKR